jgi:hypothetical protein
MGVLEASIIIGSTLAAGASVYSAEKQSASAAKGRRLQEQAQRQSLAMAAQQSRQAEAQYAMANRKKPDMTAIMAQATKGASQGAASTNLTQGKTTMLGE